MNLSTALHWHIESPQSFDTLPSFFPLYGWCFTHQGNPQVRVINIHCAGRTFSVSVVYPRPDIKILRPDSPTESIGFSTQICLPIGRHEITFEVIFEDESTHILLQKNARIYRNSYFPLWIRPRVGVSELWARQVTLQPQYSSKPVFPEKLTIQKTLKSPKFAIITPSYRQSKFLSETMCSVLNQQGVTVEYVVQDGGSTDGSVEIIRQHAAKLHAWESAPDNGQAHAIAKGFAKTSGAPDDLMAWINSDDFYISGALNYVADYFASHPEVDAVYGHRVIVNQSSLDIARWFLPKHNPEVLPLIDFIPQETLFWRRRLWAKVGGIDTSFRFAMDWDLLLRFQAAGARIVRLPRFLACFRIHSLQKTSASIHSIGKKETDQIRERSLGRKVSDIEIENHPLVLRHLRCSALTESLWKLGIRI